MRREPSTPSEVSAFRLSPPSDLPSRLLVRSSRPTSFETRGARDARAMVNSHESIYRAERKYEHYFQLPTKRVASPVMLLQAVTEQAGEGNFYIEMRHNTYYISLSENVNMKEIYSRCRR
ncbi:hypothetical protein HBI88_223000 [Parastagonospora nodorum]|nr:hypothetical protein HBI06_018430 [Parastagonospora nodorum]KAH4243232.1 hypothetical protein HBI05_080730 [Parastagonospora nodorum]KAH4993609.1 hypothetical protein HBI76_037550 [Parastagonospora nodorum]KAH5232828.1 hypothetical protein HBI62_055780 [Parastagonospora nodorum]KAH5268086.1 hypothetical protein HBI71_071890 [Parastagonospora nodorum]